MIPIDFVGSTRVPYVPISLFYRTTLYFVLFLLDKVNWFISLCTSVFFPCLHLQNRKKKKKIAFVPSLG